MKKNDSFLLLSRNHSKVRLNTKHLESGGQSITAACGG